MKDITSTTFGLVIGYFLPGIVALYALSYWSLKLQEVFQTFITTPWNLGLFLLLSLGGLALGLEITLIRWVIFEMIISKSYKLDTSNFSKLGEESTLAAYRACVDEHYRYHQFWGGMVVVIPFLYFGWAQEMISPQYFLKGAFLFIIFLAIEILTGFAAHVAYKNYVGRGNQIMKGSNNA